jgi:hypothetical protein
MFLPTVAVMAGALSMAGCTSLGEGPAPVVNAKKAQAAQDIYINGDIIGAFYSSDAKARGGLTPLQWRNTVVTAQLDAADENYAAFVNALHSERNTEALGTDLIVLGLAGGGAVASKAVANALSAASAGFVGAGAAINKELYYSSTIQALIAQMDAGRATVRAHIIQSMQGNESVYPLGSALGDIRSYEAAGTLDRAIAQVTATASAAKTAADAQVQQALFQAQIAPADVQARKKKLFDYIRAADLPTLTSLAALLKILAPATTLGPLRDQVYAAADEQGGITSTSMDNLSSALKGVTKTDY